MNTVRSTPLNALRLSRRQLLAMLALCLAGGVALGGAWVCKPVRFAREAPIDETRVQRARQFVDPNTASVASLRRLAGIGPTRARAIVEYRQGRSGQCFQRAEDLAVVRGIGPTIVRTIAGDLTWAGGDERAAPGRSPGEPSTLPAEANRALQAGPQAP